MQRPKTGYKRAKELNISITNQKSKKVERLEKRIKKNN